MKEIVIKIHDVPKNDHERWVLTHGVPLPNNPTNMDMIMALFPDVNLLKDNDNAMFFIKGKDWWNAPYNADKEG